MDFQSKYTKLKCKCHKNSAQKVLRLGLLTDITFNVCSGHV